MKKRTLSRRQFGFGCAGLGTTTLFSSLVHLGAMGSASAQAVSPGDPYKALVCILLAGGNDSFNLVVPTEGGEYAEYDQIRSDLALPQSSVLPLNVLNDPHRIGAEIENDQHDFRSLESYMLAQGEITPNTSGRQELFENVLNRYIF